MVVAHKVTKGEPVVAGDEVNAVDRQSSVISLEIATAANASGDFADNAAVAAHESADHVAVTAVPFGPGESGKRSNVVKPAGVSGFSNKRESSERPREFDIPRQRRLRQRGAVFCTHKSAGQIEAETVHSKLLYPPLQTVNDKSRYHGMVAIDGVAATREIEVPTAVSWIEQIEDVVGQTFEMDDGSVCTALSGMIENDI